MATEQTTDPLAFVAAVIDALSTAEAALIGPSDEYEGCADALAKVRAVLHGAERTASINSIRSFEREAGRREGMKTAERIAEIAAEVAEREEKLAANFEEKVRHRARAHYVQGIVEMIQTEAGEPPHDRLSATSPQTGRAAPAPEPFQSRVKPWLDACFGHEIASDRLERGDRLLEEIFELLQAAEYPRERVAQLASYVWSRPSGAVAGEIGDVMICIAAFAIAYGIDLDATADTALARCWANIEKTRAKRAAKPIGSALPQAWAQEGGDA